MNQSERRIYLIKRLLEERGDCASAQIPYGSGEQRRLLRSLMNVRMPGDTDDEFLMIQDEYLTQVNDEKGIVNAANSGMIGSYVPCHNCIDNCIHAVLSAEARWT